MNAALGPISAEALVWLRSLEDEEGFDSMTCRPIHIRSSEEKRRLYQAALDEPNTVILGLWMPGENDPIGKLTASDWNPRNRNMEVGYYLRKIEDLS